MGLYLLVYYTFKKLVCLIGGIFAGVCWYDKLIWVNTRLRNAWIGPICNQQFSDLREGYDDK